MKGSGLQGLIGALTVVPSHCLLVLIFSFELLRSFSIGICFLPVKIPGGRVNTQQVPSQTALKIAIVKLFRIFQHNGLGLSLDVLIVSKRTLSWESANWFQLSSVLYYLTKPSRTPWIYVQVNAISQYQKEWYSIGIRGTTQVYYKMPLLRQVVCLINRSRTLNSGSVWQNWL